MRAKNSFRTLYRGLLFGALASGVAIVAFIAQPATALGAGSPGLNVPLVAQATSESPKKSPAAQNQPTKSGGKSARPVSPDERMGATDMRLLELENTIEEIRQRGYTNKMMAREMLRLGKSAVIILVVIAIGFPLTLVFLGRRRILGPWNVTSDLPATLVAVEERQAKLANILREIQSEIDYIHSMSVPDLKKLIDQAEKYIEQNEKDLEKAGLAPKEDAEPSKPE